MVTHIPGQPVAPRCLPPSPLTHAFQHPVCTLHLAAHPSRTVCLIAESPKEVPVIMGTHTKELVPFKNAGPAEIHLLYSPPLLHTFCPNHSCYFKTQHKRRSARTVQKQLEIMKWECSLLLSGGPHSSRLPANKDQDH